MKLQAIKENEKRIIIDQDIIDFFNTNEKTTTYYNELCEKELDEDPNYNFVFYETIAREFLTHYLYHHEIFEDFLAQLYQYHRNLVTTYAQNYSGNQDQPVQKYIPVALEFANKDVIEYLDQCDEEYRL